MEAPNLEANPTGNHPPAREELEHKYVLDASGQPILDSLGRRVLDKPANKPFLAYQRWKAKEAEKEQAKEERRLRREEKIKKGEPLLPEDQEAKEESALEAILRLLVIGLVIFFLSSWFFTGTWTWTYEGKLTNWRTWFPSSQTYYSESQLLRFDGTDETLPILVAIDGDVYDVSANRKVYGPGGSYHFFAGLDAARAYVTGCFKDHLTHDIRGLSATELDSLDHWKNFFANHKTYFKVGTVYHKPIDPDAPIPRHCDDRKNQPEAADMGPKLKEEMETAQRETKAKEKEKEKTQEREKKEKKEL